MRTIFRAAYVSSSLVTLLALSACASKAPQMTPAEPVMPTKSIVNQGVTARIVQYGLTTSRGPQFKRFNPNVPSLTATASMENTFLEQTELIPGRIGTRFGLRFEISGLPRRTVAELQTILIHPLIKGANGQETSRSFWATRALVDANGVGRGLTGYVIEEPYEIAEGEWTFEIKRAGDVLLRQKFYMYLPKK